jgi:hypothetical protein
MTVYPGGETVGIVTYVPQVDGSGNPLTDGLNQPLDPVRTVLWKYGCVFEPEHVSEEQTNTITSRERAWVFMPVDPDTAKITNANFLTPQRPSLDENGADESAAQRDYKVHGLPLIEYDMDGKPDHIWVICEYDGG